MDLYHVYIRILIHCVFSEIVYQELTSRKREWLKLWNVYGNHFNCNYVKKSPTQNKMPHLFVLCSNSHFKRPKCSRSKKNASWLSFQTWFNLQQKYCEKYTSICDIFKVTVMKLCSNFIGWICCIFKFSMRHLFSVCRWKICLATSFIS